MHGHNGRIVPSVARFGSVIFIALTVVVVVGSPTTDLLESMDCLLRDCESCFPNADRNTAQNLIVRLQVTIDSVRGLLDSLDRDEARNTAKILVLQRNLRNLRPKKSCTSICLIRGLPTVSHGSRGVGRPWYELSLPLSRRIPRIQCDLPGLK